MASTAQPPSGLAIAKRALISPGATAVLLGALALDAVCLPEGSVVGNMCTPMHGCRLAGGPGACVFETPNGLLLAPDQFDQEAPRVSIAPEPVACVGLLGLWQRNGLWAITSRSAEPHVNIFAEARPLSAEESQVILRRFEEYVGSNWPTLAPLVKASGTRVTQTCPGGILHNGAALAVGCLALVSLGWIPQRSRRRREQTAIAQQRCPKCSYDLRDRLDAGCPECGWRRESAPK